MVNFLKKNFSSEKIGILLLAVLTILSGFIVYTQKDFSVETTSKTSSTNKNQNSYYFDDEYYGYDSYYDDYYYEYDDMFYTSSNSYYYDDSNYYNDGYYYDDYSDIYYDNYDNFNYYYDYSDTTKPSIKGSTSSIIYQYQEFEPMDGISSYHKKYGDMTDAIQITYNDVDTNIPGNYSVVYKVCNYPGSIYCTTFTKSVTVRAKNFDLDDNYSRGPIWSNTDSVTCTNGSSKCESYNVEEPIAKSPVTNRKLDVTLIDGYVDIYQEGTYVLVYYAETEYGISGTQTKKVKITGGSYQSNNKQTKKYVQNQSSEYYDDGYYRGVLTPDYKQPIQKYIEDYKWENTVGYKYRCDVVGQSGTDGWSYVSTDISNGQLSDNADNHPTYKYDNGVFSGTLDKTNFYCKENCGEKTTSLGVCKNEGEIKYVYSTWVGVYAGYVYSNTYENQTYSGYVYLYR